VTHGDIRLVSWMSVWVGVEGTNRIRQMFKSLKTSLRTIALLVAVVCLGLLAHGGVLSSDMMNKLGVLDFEGLYGKLVPIGVNILMAALFLSVS